MEYGTNRLLKQGATLVTDVKDIMNSFPNLDYEEQNKPSGINKNLVPEQYLEIYRLIQKKGLDTNEICRELKMPVNKVSSLLFMMELEGFAEKLSSGEYKIKGE